MALITSVIAGVTAKSINNTKIVYVICFFAAISTILNWGNRKMVPEDSNAFTHHVSMYSEYYEPDNPIYQQRYRNRINNVPDLVAHRPSAHLELLSGKGEVKETARTQIDHKYLVHANTDLLLSENTYYFPGWKIYVNGIATPVDIQNKKRFGTLVFPLKKGLYLIDAKFEDTPVRKAGKYISLLALLLVILKCFKQKLSSNAYKVE